MKNLVLLCIFGFHLDSYILTVEDVLQKFYQLQQLDEDVCEFGKKLAMNVFTGNKGITKTQKAAIHNINFAGSLSEGSATARIFQVNPLFPDGLNREMEVDIEYTLLEIPETYKHMIYDIPNKIGYVNLQVDFNLLKKVDRLGWLVNDDELSDILGKVTTKEGWLQPYKLKFETLSKVKFKNNDKAVELILAAALDKHTDDVSIDGIVQDVTKSSVGSDFMIKIDKKPFIKFSFDTVTLFRLPWWPSVANEWKYRQRNWPSQDVIEKISLTSYLIAKPSFDEKYNAETTELRYAFAHVERDLVHMRSKHQNMIYLILKVALYKWIKPIDSDKISSFIGKTIMFWTCEKYPPEHKFWSNDYQSTVSALSYLFKQLFDAFQSGYLPYFFNKNENVIKAIPLTVRDEVSRKIQFLLNDVNKYLPINIEKELQAGKEILHMIRSANDVFNEIKQKDYSRFLRQPALINDFLTFYINQADFDDIKVKIKREADRLGEKIENEAKRFANKVKKEAKRFKKRFGL